MNEDKLKHLFKKSKNEFNEKWMGENRLLNQIKQGRNKLFNKKKVLQVAYSMMVALILLTGVYQIEKMNTKVQTTEFGLEDFINIYEFTSDQNTEIVAYNSANTGYVDEYDYEEEDYINHLELL